MKKLTVSQIIDIHKDIIEETGGSTGIRDFGLLESAAYAPFQTFDGEPLYPSIQQKRRGWLMLLPRTIPLLTEIKELAFMLCSCFSKSMA
jgi:death-on-curing protein